MSRRIEIPHNTPEQVTDYLAGALAIVESLELNDELYPLAFSKAVDLLSAKTLQVEQVAPLPGPAFHIPRG